MLPFNEFLKQKGYSPTSVSITRIAIGKHGGDRKKNPFKGMCGDIGVVNPARDVTVFPPGPLEVTGKFKKAKKRHDVGFPTKKSRSGVVKKQSNKN